jgi:SAM-dependent methyltransferase
MDDRSSAADWDPVAPTWEKNPDDREIWRRVAVMPALALNRVEMDYLGPVAGRRVCVLTVADGMAPLALAALGARVTVIDPTNGALDVLVVRAQVVGLELQYQQCELTDLCTVGDGTFQLAYAGQASGLVPDLGHYYSCVNRALAPGGRLVVNEYHPFRRIWRQESGSPRVARSYFERRPRRGAEDADEDITRPGADLERFRNNWTVSDHVRAITGAGFRLTGMNEVGESRQSWELPALTGLPEQLIICADRPTD